MLVFRYDKSFDGLLTAVFDAFNRKSFPEMLIGMNDIEPLFATEIFDVMTDDEKSKRVWSGLKKKLMSVSQNMLAYVWLSEEEGSDMLIFRYVKKVFENEQSVEMNFADDDVLGVRNTAKRVNTEKHRMIEFVRFQKAADNLYFAAISPDTNCLALITSHFRSRFADQQWIIFDTKRSYGFHYNLKTISEVTFENDILFKDGRLDEKLMAEDEKIFQNMWKAYYKSLTIKERINPKLQRQHLPQRYRKYLTELQD
ncbi:MAG: TIGR03915 family putative DNA repair protein [Paludibacteraceae bacterium]|nr:TIGR03915 family putative DNA repair protein [Paludibacteraceae bacterium]